MNIEHHLRTKKTAEYLGVSQQILASWRVNGEGPPYSKLGKRIIVYKVEDLDAWVQQGRRTSTSCPAEAN